MEEFKLYTIKHDYLMKLKEIDNEVMYKEQRPYIAIMINYNNKYYMIPISSFKSNKKFKIPHSYYDKITNNNEILAYILYHKMIPIKEGCYELINIKNVFSNNNKYIDLCFKEYLWIRKNKDKVKQKALYVYQNLIKEKQPKSLRGQGVKLKLIEKHYNN